MIHDRGNSSIQFPVGWSVPAFELGQVVEVDDRTGQIIGCNHYTSDLAAAAGCLAGWWYWVAEQRTLSDGKVIIDTFGYDEDVIQLLPCDVPTYDRQPLAV